MSDQRASTDPLEALRASRDADLPKDLEQQILALRTDAVAALFEIAEEPALWSDDKTYRWGRAHTVRLLCELRIPATYPRLVERFLAASADDDFNQWEACIHHLPPVGLPMLDCAFDMLREKPDRALSLAFLIGAFEEDDERVRAFFMEHVENHAGDIAAIVSTDPHESWAPLMVRTLEKLLPAPWSAADALSVAEALIELTGALPAHLREKIVGWEREWLRESPGWRRRIGFGAVRADGTIEAQEVMLSGGEPN